MALLSNNQLTKREVADISVPFLRLAFRPFFWLGALFGAVSIALWALSFAAYIDFSPYGGSYFWHVHEMLFGFTVAIIVGFLLTAVQTWTGVESIKGMPLGLLAGIWLSARLLSMFPDSGTLLITVVADLLFLPLSAIALAIPIVKAKQWHNLFFVPILLIMAVLNGLTHLAVMQKIAISFISISHIMVLLVSLVMCIMGGRVFPMFTANGTGTPRVASIAWIEKLSIVSIILSIFISANIVDTPNTFDALIYLVTGIANFVRALRWRIWGTFSTPLVWPLHLSYWAVCIGFIMLSLVELELLANLSTAYHAITVGGISFMILAMISRVSLGHTGREIQVGKVMSSAFILMTLAFIVRVFVPYIWDNYSLAMLLSATLWVLAYGIFITKYSLVLFKARVDGAKG